MFGRLLRKRPVEIWERHQVNHETCCSRLSVFLGYELVALFAVVDRAVHHLLQARVRCKWPTEKTQHLSVVWMVALVWMYIWHGLVRRKWRPWCLRWPGPW